jgi:hypothetical protein
MIKDFLNIGYAAKKLQKRISIIHPDYGQAHRLMSHDRG